MSKLNRCLWALVTSVLFIPCAISQESQDALLRRASTALVSWRAPLIASNPVSVRLIGMNDFHGELLSQTDSTGHGVGGAAVLAAYIAAERASMKKHSLLLIAGDSIGASPLISALLQDEPTIRVLNALAVGDCPYISRPKKSGPVPPTTRCQTIATVGNHEFDRGTTALTQLLYGGARNKTPGWPGSRIPFTAANVLLEGTDESLFPTSLIADLGDLRIGIIGAGLSSTPLLVSAAQIHDLRFTSEASAINKEVARLKAAGVNTIVLVIHQGLQSPSTPQPATLALDELQGGLKDVLAELDGGIDVIVAGHTHSFNNMLVRLRDGSETLITQARSYGTSYSAIDLVIDQATGRTIGKSARIMTAWTSSTIGQHPDREIQKIVTEANKKTHALADRQIGIAALPIRREPTPSGESALGDLVADAQRAAAGTDIAFMNQGGLRHDLEAGPISYGELHSIQPFGNIVKRFSLTGEQIMRLLTEQWTGIHAKTHLFLHPSGLRYEYDLSAPAVGQIIAAWDADGQPIDRLKRYTVAASDYLLGGGDAYPVFSEVTTAETVAQDLVALEHWLTETKMPLVYHADGRIKRHTGAACTPNNMPCAPTVRSSP